MGYGWQRRNERSPPLPQRSLYGVLHGGDPACRAGLGYGAVMTIRIRKTKEAVPKTGSYKVEFSDGRKPEYFHYEDEPADDQRAGLSGGEGVWEGEKG
jgi:hypothetical protein